MTPNDPGIAETIVTSLKTTGLAIVVGGVFGLHGMVFGAGGGIFGLVGIFGGIGLLLTAFHVPLCLPIIHCIYAYVIIRFKLRGILSVMALHYSSAILFVTIWLAFDLPSHKGSIGAWLSIKHGFYHLSSNWAWSPVSTIIFTGIPFAVMVVTVIFYNGILFCLLWYALKNRKRNLLTQDDLHDLAPGKKNRGHVTKQILASVMSRELMMPIGLALVVGGILGVSGYVVGAMMNGIGIFVFISAFGGIGLLLNAFRASFLLPVIHCAYVYIIIRFKLRGILTIMALHYLSAIVITTIWIWFDLPYYSWKSSGVSPAIFFMPEMWFESSMWNYQKWGYPGIWSSIRNDIWIREGLIWDPIYGIVNDGIRFFIMIGLLFFYNGIWFFLLRRALKNKRVVNQ